MQYNKEATLNQDLIYEIAKHCSFVSRSTLHMVSKDCRKAVQHITQLLLSNDELDLYNRGMYGEEISSPERLLIPDLINKIRGNPHKMNTLDPTGALRVLAHKKFIPRRLSF